MVIRATVICLLLGLWMAGSPSPVHGLEPEGFPNDLLSAPTELEVGGEKLTIESGAYLNLMPPIKVPGRKIDCTRPLIVPIKFNVRVLPRSTAIERVWVHSEGKWWSGNFNANETWKGDRLVMISRGCAAHVFTPQAAADVIVEVQYERTKQYLRAPAKPLGAAY